MLSAVSESTIGIYVVPRTIVDFFPKKVEKILLLLIL